MNRKRLIEEQEKCKKRKQKTLFYNDILRKKTAHSKVHAAIKKGELTKQACDRCGEIKVQAHHHVSYKPKDWLNVTWLCRKCHDDWHKYFGNVL